MIEEEASKNPMMSQEEIRRAKGRSLKHPNHNLPQAEPITDDFMEMEDQYMGVWLKYWHYRYQE